MKYEMQIKIEDPKDCTKKIWKSIRQTPSSAPYQYDTEEQAWHVLRICYGHALFSDEMRVIEAK